jgi:hypothetical protein
MSLPFGGGLSLLREGFGMTQTAPIRHGLNRPKDEVLYELAQLTWTWPATFSRNARGEIWPSVTKGLTPEHTRFHVQGRVPALDRIAQTLLRMRPKGGRFYITHDGVYLSDGDRFVIEFSG